MVEDSVEPYFVRMFGLYVLLFCILRSIIFHTMGTDTTEALNRIRR